MTSDSNQNTSGSPSGYKLSRNFFDFAFENRECNVYHAALFAWIVELNNRFGWKRQFGLPTAATMEGLSIGNKRTYLSAVRDLEKWGFIKIISEGKNQYQSSIIELCHSNNAPALIPALDTSLKQQNPGIDTNIAPIVKQVNNKTKNNKTFIPPKLDEVILYCKEHGHTSELAIKAFEHYNVAEWIDAHGEPVINWKQKILTNWINKEPKNKVNSTQLSASETAQQKRDMKRIEIKTAA